MQDTDIYSDEASGFEADVNPLIRNTLQAALANLSAAAESELAEITKAIDKAVDSEVQEHLVETHVDVLATGLSQERFLRNMALVALAARLLHVLKKMARFAEHFCPSTHNYKGKSEFLKLWTEYEARFSIDFKVHVDRIAFVAPMVEVRNRIVHAGAEANAWNDATLQSLRQGQEPALDTYFSRAYPDFVDGEGWNAEVVVSQEQLDRMCDSSVGLVWWLAKELDALDQVR